MNTTEALASLESRIMNLPATTAWDNDALSRAYKEGHRDARHAAAELVSAALAQAEQPEPIRDDAQASQFLEERLWEFIDMAAKFPHAKPDQRTWAHVMVYAPKAEQAQPVAALLRSRRVTTWPHAAMDMQTHYSEWGDWLPTTYKHAKAVTDPSRNTDPMCYEMLPLYAAPPAAQPLTPLTDTRATELVQSVVSSSERPIGMVAYGLLVVRATEQEYGIGQPARLGYMDGDVA